MATQHLALRHPAELVLRRYVEAMLRQHYTLPEIVEALMALKIELVNVENWQKVVAEADFAP